MQIKSQFSLTQKVISYLIFVSMLLSAFTTENLPIDHKSNIIEADTAEEALRMALEAYADQDGLEFNYKIFTSFESEGFAYATGEIIDLVTNERSAEEIFVPLLAKVTNSGAWQSVAPKIVTDNEFNTFLLSFPDSVIDESTKAYLYIPDQPQPQISPKNSSGHKLPWPSGQWASVTRKNGTGHELQIDFNILGTSSSGDVYASKTGTVVFVKESSNQNCTVAPPDPCWKKANMVVVQHSASEFSWYVHLALNSVPVSVGNPVGFGTKIGVEGTTGYSTGVHLHYMTSTGHTSWTDPNDANAAPWGTGITATDFSEVTWDGLTAGNTYTSQNSSGGGGSCSAPSLSNPNEGFVSSSQTVNFSWSALSGCVFNGYTLRIRTDNNMDGSNPIYDQGVGETSRSVDIPSQYNNQDLYWGVRAANAASGASWSVRKFRIEPGSGNSCNPTANQVALYADGNYSGTCVIKSLGDYPNPSSIGIANDSVSSIKVGGNVKLTICRDDNYSGTCETFQGDDSNLGDNGIGDNQVSSAKVENRNGYPVTLYADANYGGGWCALTGAGWSNICDGYNDTASSIKILSGWSARVWEHSDRNGASRCFTGDFSNFSGQQFNENGNGNMDNAASSFEAYNQGTCPALVPNTPTNFRAASSTSTSITLAWDDVSNETGYKLYEWNGSSFVYLASVGANITSFTETRSTCGWNEFYEVSAYNNNGESQHTSWVQGFTQPCSNTSTFADVPTNAFAWAQIQSIYDAGITGGCSTNPLNYCPSGQVTRAQMAVFLLRGIHGSSYTPPTALGTMFNDVASNSFAAAWIERFASEGITGGCGNGNFCPSGLVTRAQMAVFLLKAKHGSGYTPPAATGTMFNDVPTNAFAAAWIEQLATEGITGGCGSGNYCPNSSVTRAQMAVFLQKTFNLPLP